jgi:DNA recombination protein RmuC
MNAILIIVSVLCIIVIIGLALWLFRVNAQFISAKTAKEEQAKSIQSLEEVISQLKEESKVHFQNIANQIIENQSVKLTQKNGETLANILNPLNKEISEFKRKVEDQQLETSKQNSELKERIKTLAEQSKNIGEQATDLANALKGQKKTQGDWGEQILENILRQSGLIEGKDYEAQYNVKTEDNKNIRPDFVINLPNGRKVVIDSKVSLNSYVAYCGVDDDDGRKNHIADYIKAVKNNIDGLAQKNYEKNVLDSLDFVLMFFPIEPAFILAVSEDIGVLNYAYDKKILLVSPSQLMTSLRMINDMWTKEKQDKNIVKIIKGVEALYEKFIAFSKSLRKIGENLEAAKDNYDKALNQLSEGKGNVIKRTEDLKQLGIKTKSKLPQALLEQAEETNYGDAEFGKLN